MKKTRLLVILLVVAALISACAQDAEPVLTVVGQPYTQSDLEDLTTVSVDYTNKDGETTTYNGVPLTVLLEDADASEGGDTLVFTAADGYEAEMALAEALACSDCIVAFDDGSLRMVMPDMSSKLQVKDVVEISVQ